TWMLSTFGESVVGPDINSSLGCWLEKIIHDEVKSHLAGECGPGLQVGLAPIVDYSSIRSEERGQCDISPELFQKRNSKRIEVLPDCLAIRPTLIKQDVQFRAQRHKLRHHRA